MECGRATARECCGKKLNEIFVRDVRGELVGEMIATVVSVEKNIISERNLSSVLYTTSARLLMASFDARLSADSHEVECR